MGKYTAVTIVARNYLAQARVLRRSFAEHNPAIEFHTLLVDGTEEDRSTAGVGTILLPTDIGIDAPTLHSMMLIYDVMELSTALKPAVLTTLISKSDAAAYLDPDIRVYAPLDDVFDAARDHGIALTPHTLHPIPRDDRNLTERDIMQAGIYNLGFIAVGQTSRPFLAWWHERLRTDAIVDIENALFTDQRWVDWVPALFPHVILRDQGLNAAYWNLHERPITTMSTGYFAGTSPLRFFHFSGFDPEVPWLLSKHMGDKPRTLLSESAPLRELCLAYKAELDEFSHSQLRRTPYGLDTLPNGFRLTPEVRRMARISLVGQLPFAPAPDAFADPAAFTAWLTDPGTDGLSPRKWAIWNDSADARAAFPDPFGSSFDELEQWFRENPVGKTEGSRGRVLPQRTKRTRGGIRTAPHAFGWSVVAYANAELGVGEAGRRTADAVAATGVPMEVVGTTLASVSRQKHTGRRDVRATVGFQNVITCVNADVLPFVNERLGLSSLRGYHAGLWFWELEEFPGYHGKSLSLLHEVWVASEFTQKAIQNATDKPVRLIRMPIELPDWPTAYTRRSLGMPDAPFVFLTNFDYLSVSERKNPLGVIRAYLDAFGPDDGAVLIVKSVNAHQRLLDAERVRSVASHRPDVLFMDDYISAAEMKAMIELADCYVSLHRSEGYGLNLADAMAHGTPTIATGYSGNLAFQTADTSMLIPYKIVEVGPMAAPYNPRALWAEPNLHEASTAMRRVFDNREIGVALAARARAHVALEHSLQAAAESMRGVLLGTGRTA